MSDWSLKRNLLVQHAHFYTVSLQSLQTQVVFPLKPILIWIINHPSTSAPVKMSIPFSFPTKVISGFEVCTPENSIFLG